MYIHIIWKFWENAITNLLRFVVFTLNHFLPLIVLLWIDIAWSQSAYREKSDKRRFSPVVYTRQPSEMVFNYFFPCSFESWLFRGGKKIIGEHGGINNWISCVSPICDLYGTTWVGGSENRYRCSLPRITSMGRQLGCQRILRPSWFNREVSVKSTCVWIIFAPFIYFKLG